MKTGEVIGGRFELRAVLGEGGMGQVFKAWDSDLDRYVAIKTLLPQFMSDPASLEEMKQEVRLSQRLNHPAIVAVYDYRVQDRMPFIIMEFVEGVPLNHHLYRLPAKRMDESSFLACADQILAGVGYAHDRGVVHRDLKPANIMVAPNGHVKLMDFGIAAAIKATYTRITGRSPGLTPQYSSPEQINGANPSPGMDIYSLGCVFYEMLTGHPPFYQGEVLHQQLTRQPPSMPGVSPLLNSVVLGCLAKDPQKRFKSATEVRSALLGERTVRLPKGGPRGAGLQPNRRHPEAPEVTGLALSPSLDPVLWSPLPSGWETAASILRDGMAALQAQPLAAGLATVGVGVIVLAALFALGIFSYQLPPPPSQPTTQTGAAAGTGGSPKTAPGSTPAVATSPGVGQESPTGVDSSGPEKPAGSPGTPPPAKPDPVSRQEKPGGITGKPTSQGQPPSNNPDSTAVLDWLQSLRGLAEAGNIAQLKASYDEARRTLGTVKQLEDERPSLARALATHAEGLPTGDPMIRSVCDYARSLDPKLRAPVCDPGARK